MRIRCPSCSATYEVPDTLVERPRMVRCAKCAHDWLATAIDDDPLPEPAIEEPAETGTPVHEPASHEPELEPALGPTPLSAIERLTASLDLSPRIRRRDRMLTAAWAISFAALAALGVAGYTKRDALMREWPASKRVYGTLGLVPMDAKNPDQKGTSGQPER
jgi:predicted Zn finger-like uncharacterized protein